MNEDGGSGEATNTTESLIFDQTSSMDLPINVSDLLHILANKRTRYLLYLLTERNGTVLLEEVEEYFEGEDAGAMLHHRQLPKLADFNIISYDRDIGAITLTPIGDELEPALETVHSLEQNDANEFLAQASR